MTRTPRALPLALLLVLAACTTTTSDETASPSAGAQPTPDASPTASATSEATASAEHSETPDESAEPSATPVGGEPGGFTFHANAEADSLYTNRFSCQNLDDGYEVDFPSEWNANAEYGEVPQCSWFAPTEYEAGDGRELPAEVAIVVFVQDGPREYPSAEVIERAEGFIGVTQPAYRVLGQVGDETFYEYVVQLGPSLEEGPNLVAGTADTRGGDFDLNRAVLDRMMATMEFIGVIQ